MKKILFEDALILSVSKFLRLLVRVLPLSYTLLIARGVGFVLYYFTKRRNIAQKNLRAAFAGQMSPRRMRVTARRSMQNLAMSVAELLSLPDMDRRHIDRHFEFVGTERLDPEIKKGKGIIFLTGHFGSWELLSLSGSLKGYPLVALARRQKHPKSDEFLNWLRSSKGNQVILKGMPVREILKALKTGRIVGMVSDQDGGKNGTFVRFFNRLSSTPPGVAAFALRTGAPVFPVFIFRTGGLGHRVEVDAPIWADPADGPEAERRVLQHYADALESKIRRAPEQWLWAHRRWKSTPDRFVLVLSDGVAGHLNQSLAVAQEIRDRRAAQGFVPENMHLAIRQVRFNKGADGFLRVLGFLCRGHFPFKQTLLRLALTRQCYNEILGAYADVVVSTGSSLQAVNLLVKHENQARNIVVMRPFFPVKRFDAVIAPQHDRIKKADNVFLTGMALSPITPDAMKEEAEKLTLELGVDGRRKRIGLLVGGDSGKTRFSVALFREAMENLSRAGHERGAAFLATSSRRTPSWANAVLKETFTDKARCPLLVIANEANRPGIVPGILGLSDLLVVSGESMSMVTEAVSTGKPVVVFTPFAPTGLKAKHKDFLNRLHAAGAILWADDVYAAVAACAAASGPDGPARAFLAKDREVLKQAVSRLI